MLETVVVGDELIKAINSAIRAALSYEKATHQKRRLGITGEVGELLVCHQLGLRLVLDTRSEGFDALDKGGRRVQIKTRRSESEGLPKDRGRVSRFSEHPFDYALMGLLDHQYRLCEVWRADYKRLKPIIKKQERRNPTLLHFKNAGKRVFVRND